MKRKRWLWPVGLLLLLIGFVFANNTNLFRAANPNVQSELLAHRGIAQRFDERDVRADTCTASRMLPPRHALLENTIASMQASFEAGADIVEFDVHPTTDGQFAVFHDWTVDCRTDGRGVTREHSMPELKKLDIGYGYTADGGQTYPFRGQGVGLMPSLDEVLSAFPGRSFLINVKSRDPAEGALLARVLGRLPPDERARLMVYGGDEPIEVLRQHLPDVRTTSRAALKACLLGYMATGWTGVVPASCGNRLVLVPINVAPWLWGWPGRFVDRMEKAGSKVFLLGPYSGGDFSKGIDSPADFDRVPADYAGGIYTNEIEAAASVYKSNAAELDE